MLTNNKTDVIISYKIKQGKKEVKIMTRTLVFDMDGTIANFYGVDGWLSDLQASNPRPYIIAEPMYDTDVLNTILKLLKTQGWKIVVTSWLAKGSDKVFDEMTRQAKREWLARYDFPFDEIHLIKYGTTKANCTRKIGGYQILVDDNEQVRKGWNLGDTINANENILEKLCDLLLTE